MSKPSRLRLAQFLGRQCTSAAELRSLALELGWDLTDEEFYAAESCLTLPEDVGLHGIPFFYKQYHVCRAEQMAGLTQTLLDTARSQKNVLVIHGMAGMGKTELALNMVHSPEVRNRFPGGIFWINMEEQEEDFLWVSLADLLGLEVVVDDMRRDTRVLGRLKRRVLHALPRDPSLVVLDGIEVAIDVEPWLGRPNRRLLVTTQLAQWLHPRIHEQTSIHEIDVMSAEESWALLTQGISVNIPEEDLQKLLVLLGKHPLALAIVNQMARSDAGFHVLVAQMKEPVLPHLDLDWGTRQYGRPDKSRNVQWAFTLSYNRLDAPTQKLFRFFGVLPQPFNIQLIEEISGLRNVGAGLRTIVGQGLLKIEQVDSYRTHRLLHEYARILAEQKEPQDFLTWKEGFAAYYLDLSHDIVQLWKSGQEREALSELLENEQNFQVGYAYAADLRLQEWLLGYWNNLHPYLGLTTRDTSLVSRWYQILRKAVIDEDIITEASGFVGHAYFCEGDAQSAIPLLERNREWRWDRKEEREWVLATINLGQAWLLAGERNRVLSLLHEQDNAYERIINGLQPGDVLRSTAWHFFGMIRSVIGDSWAANYGYRKALESFNALPKELRNLWGESRIYLDLGTSYILLGKHSEAAEAFAKGMRSAETGGYTHLWGAMALQRVDLLIREKELQAAEDLFQEANRRAGNDTRLKWQFLHLRGDLAWAHQKAQEGENAYAQALERVDGTLWEPELWWKLAGHRKKSGDQEGKVKAWQKTRETARKTGHRFKYLHASLAYGEYLLEQGATDEGRAVLTELIFLAAEEEQFSFIAEAATLLDMPDDIVQGLRKRGMSHSFPFAFSLIAEREGIPVSVSFLESGVHGEKRWISVPGFGQPEEIWSGTTLPESYSLSLDAFAGESCNLDETQQDSSENEG